MSRSRGKNYTDVERSQILEIVKNYRGIIDDKCTNKKSLNEKANAWASITKQFNAVSSSGPRDVLQVKILYGNLKRVSRRSHKTNIVKTEEHRPLEQQNIDQDELVNTSGCVPIAPKVVETGAFKELQKINQAQVTCGGVYVPIAPKVVENGAFEEHQRIIQNEGTCSGAYVPIASKQSETVTQVLTFNNDNQTRPLVNLMDNNPIFIDFPSQDPLANSDVFHEDPTFDISQQSSSSISSSSSSIVCDSSQNRKLKNARSKMQSKRNHVNTFKYRLLRKKVEEKGLDIKHKKIQHFLDVKHKKIQHFADIKHKRIQHILDLKHKKIQHFLDVKIKKLQIRKLEKEVQ